MCPLSLSRRFFAAIASAALCLGLQIHAVAGEMVVWYRQPAQRWTDASPLGNGLTAAMVFGGTKTERIALNNSSFWSGRPHGYDDPNAGKYFAQIKALMAEQKFQEAEKMVDDHFYGSPNAQQAYQPIGDLLLPFDGVDDVENYRRELDMETGVAKVTYRSGGVTFTRETFISYPDRVMVMRITADKPGSVSFEARLNSPGRFVDKITATPRKLVLNGSWRKPASQTNWLIAPVEGEGIRFEVAMTAGVDGGKITATTNSLRVTKADAVTLLLTTSTSHINYHDISGDPIAQCAKTLANCADKNNATLRRRHEEDFRGLMGRVHLRIGDAGKNDKPIEERLAAVRAGGRDPNLEALVFQLGRYILVASSRAGGQSANLQGSWNEDVLPRWGCKYTININTEMNWMLHYVARRSGICRRLPKMDGSASTARWIYRSVGPRDVGAFGARRSSREMYPNLSGPWTGVESAQPRLKPVRRQLRFYGGCG